MKTPVKMAVLLSLIANVAELVDALDLGSSGVTRESSSLSFRKNYATAESADKFYKKRIDKLMIGRSESCKFQLKK